MNIYRLTNISKSSLKFQILRVLTNFSEKELAIVQMKKKKIFVDLFQDLAVKNKDILIQHQLIVFFLRTSYDDHVKSLLKNKVAL